MVVKITGLIPSTEKLHWFKLSFDNVIRIFGTNLSYFS